MPEIQNFMYGIDGALLSRAGYGDHGNGQHATLDRGAFDISSIRSRLRASQRSVTGAASGVTLFGLKSGPAK
jgi:hypothetical protein